MCFVCLFVFVFQLCVLSWKFCYFKWCPDQKCYPVPRSTRRLWQASSRKGMWDALPSGVSRWAVVHEPACHDPAVTRGLQEPDLEFPLRASVHIHPVSVCGKSTERSHPIKWHRLHPLRCVSLHNKVFEEHLLDQKVCTCVRCLTLTNASSRKTAASPTLHRRPAGFRFPPCASQDDHCCSLCRWYAESVRCVCCASWPLFTQI